MSFRQILGSSNFRKWSQWEEGDSFEGIYQSSSIDKYNKPNYVFNVTTCDFSDPNQNRPEGDLFTLNSCGSLDKAMEKVNEGDYVKVIYCGKDIATSGNYKGKEFHKLEVYIKDIPTTKTAKPVVQDSGESLL